ncbi:MAG: hypothetical protein M0020_05830 [Actinomycetota bacterium]|nr:hypothetical protein [Actinomycetota bacterium]
MSSTALYVVDPSSDRTAWRRRLTSPQVVAMAVYCAAVMVARQWWALPLLTAEVGAALICRRLWRWRRARQPRPDRTIAGAVLGGAVILRDGVIATLADLVIVVALCALVALGWLAGILALLIAGQGVPAILAGLAAFAALVVRRTHGHSSPGGTPPGVWPPQPGGGAGPSGTTWASIIADGNSDLNDGPTDHYSRQIRRTNRLREEEAAHVYAQGRSDGAASHWGRRAGRREASYGAGFSEGFATGREAHRCEVWGAGEAGAGPDDTQRSCDCGT